MYLGPLVLPCPIPIPGLLFSLLGPSSLTRTRAAVSSCLFNCSSLFLPFPITSLLHHHRETNSCLSAFPVLFALSSFFPPSRRLIVLLVLVLLRTFENHFVRIPRSSVCSRAAIPRSIFLDCFFVVVPHLATLRVPATSTCFPARPEIKGPLI